MGRKEQRAYITARAKTNDTGYSQSASKKTGRFSRLDYNPGNFDCSASAGAAAYKGGFIKRSDLSGTFYSGNIVNRLVSTGMYRAIDIRKLSFAKQKAKLRADDIVRGYGHVVTVVDNGKVVSFEASENNTLYGKPGDQTGREGRVRDFYPRSRGWSHILRLYSPGYHLGRLIARYDESGQVHAATADRLTRRASWDGPRWEWFMDEWMKLDQGMLFEYDPAKVIVPDNHVFVVLGSALASDGSMRNKFRRRLDLVLPILLENPEAKVLISGGKPQNGITEADAGRGYLFAKGVKADQILTEEKSTSTIGNAKYSVEYMAMAGITNYTLVSDVQQLRRAQIEFLAAQVKRETRNNGLLDMTWHTPLAFNNYGDKPIAPEKPASASFRHVVANEVALLVGVQAHYQKALN